LLQVDFLQIQKVAHHSKHMPAVGQWPAVRVETDAIEAPNCFVY